MTQLYSHVIRLLCPYRADCILWTSFLLFMQISQHLKHFIIGLCIVIHYGRKTKQVVWSEWSEQSSSSLLLSFTSSCYVSNSRQTEWHLFWDTISSVLLLSSRLSHHFVFSTELKCCRLCADSTPHSDMLNCGWIYFNKMIKEAQPL